MTTRPFSRWRTAHVIASSAVDLEAFLARAPENVPATDHDRRFHSQSVNFLQFARDGENCFAVNAKSLRPLDRFAGKLQ